MNNRDRLKAMIGFENNEAVEGVMIDYGINGDLTYDGSKVITLKRAAIDVLKVLLSTADTGNGTAQGFGYTQKYDRNAVLRRIADLQEELEPTDTTPKIRSKTHMW